VEVTVLYIRTGPVWDMGWRLYFMFDKYIWCDCVPAIRMGCGSGRCPKCSTYCICYRLVPHICRSPHMLQYLVYNPSAVSHSSRIVQDYALLICQAL
jgi:hypothetical protein